MSSESGTDSRDLHLLTMATGVLLSLLTCKTELVVRGVYGASKTQCIAILAAYYLPCGGATSSTTRLVRILLSLPWPPSCIASCQGLRMTSPLSPFRSYRALKLAPLPALPWMLGTLTETTPFRMRGLFWPRPAPCTVSPQPQAPGQSSRLCRNLHLRRSPEGHCRPSPRAGGGTAYGRYALHALRLLCRGDRAPG